mgnify:CR=1 FL=1
MNNIRTIKIGRSKANDCIFFNSTVSSNHAVLIVDADRKIGLLKDLNSTNGTFVNNRKITKDTHITDNDIIKFGSEITSLKGIIAKSEKTIIKSIPIGIDRKTIGKNPNCDIHFTQNDVSREHAIIYKNENGAIIIEDSGSTNGTYVNGIKITSQELHHGDKVTITRNYPFDWESVYNPPLPNPTPRLHWKKIAIIVIAIIIVIGGGILGYDKINKNKNLSPEEIYTIYKKSVALICNEYTFEATVGNYNLSDVVNNMPNNYYLDESGKLQAGVAISTGTGFFISQDGRLVTNRHVVSLMGYENAIENHIKSLISKILTREYGSQAKPIINNLDVHYTQSISIALNDAFLNNEKDLLPCTILKLSDNKNLDIAVIQLNTKETPHSITKLVDLNNIADDKHISLGKNLYTIGFPKGLEWALTQQGIQTTNESGSVNQNVSEYLYGHNINVTHGSSGSPIFDTKGRFAGVIVSGHGFQTVTPSGEIQTIPVKHNQAIKPKPVATFIKNVY